MPLLLLSFGTVGKDMDIKGMSRDEEKGRDVACDVPAVANLLIRQDTSDFIRLIRIDSFKLKILPPSSGVQFFKDRIVFLSMSKNETRMSPKQISFGAVEAYSAVVMDSVTGRHTVLSPSSSFTSPCEAMTFSHDYSTIYLSKLSKKDKKEQFKKAPTYYPG